MSSIHFKFRSGSQYETIYFDGYAISLKDLKESIVEKMRMGKSTEFKLEISDSATAKEYTNDNEMIPKNSSVIVRRVPLYYDKSSDIPLEEAERRRADELAKIANIARANASEKQKLEAIQIQSAIVNEESEASLTQSSNQKVAICYHCKQIGHVIKDCPIISKQVSKGKEPVHVFLKNQLGLPLVTKPVKPQQVVQQISPPDYLICSLCKKILNNAVVIPCCGASFCDNCIQDYLIDFGFLCPSCKKTSMPDDLIPNLSLRRSAIEFENQHPKTVAKVDIPQQPVIEEAKDLVVGPPNVVPLTNVNTIPIVQNSLITSLPLHQMALATSAFLMKSFLPKLNANNIKPNQETVRVSAPFLTAKYATSVISGDRILTREEFGSLKIAIHKEQKANEYISSKSSRERNGHTKSSSRRSPNRRHRTRSRYLWTMNINTVDEI